MRGRKPRSKYNLNWRNEPCVEQWFLDTLQQRMIDKHAEMKKRYDERDRVKPANIEFKAVENMERGYVNSGSATTLDVANTKFHDDVREGEWSTREKNGNVCDDIDKVVEEESVVKGK
ncbi:hypothetical protein NDU88_003955 [Pleurodeles waltl]|uniref:Uncharacterized protein n=1 Tax=Pleurodeles waltl TaxID=8319 RepID=A0AAV7RJN6_PLEWA|nr:hypothetical protein NDU88_003955 [Pleurodeles waltl]